MFKNNLPELVNYLFFLLTLFLNLNLPSPRIWVSLGDPYDYIQQSKIPLLTKEFFFPVRTKESDPRPFIVPLVYKIAGSNPEAIIQLQKLIHSLAAFFLIKALLLFISKNIIKYIIVICIYLLMSWWNILGWAIIPISESLSFSLMFLWIASFLFWLNKKNFVLLIIHLIITLFFAFTRHIWPYILVVYYSVLVVFFCFYEKPFLKKGLILLGFSIILFLFHFITFRGSGGTTLPVINTIIVRIIPDESYTRWFVEHGMPCADSLKVKFPDINDAENINDRIKIYAFYNDTTATYKPFFDWIEKKAETTYFKFLITHPSYTLLLKEPVEKLKRILAYNLWYTGSVEGYSHLAHNIFPLFNSVILSVLLLTLIYLYYRKRHQILLFPVYFSFVFMTHVLLAYNSDALEVERHLFVTNIIIQFLGFYSSAIILDNADLKFVLKKILLAIKHRKSSKIEG